MARDDEGMIVHDFDDTSGASEYASLDDVEVPVVVDDDEVPEVIVSDEELTINEGSSGTYTIVLSHPIAASVEILPSITPAGSSVTFSPEDVVFTSSNWNRPKTVTLTAGEDDDGDDETLTVSHAWGDSDEGTEEFTSLTILFGRN